jgi:alkylation response protein AidB-like acyl-CoA dehydrogenase
MQRQLENAVAYVRARKQFGQAIGKYQSVANRIVDMKLRLDTCRLLVYRIGWLKDRNRNALLEASLAKLHVSECFVQSCLDAMQTFGGYGYMTDQGVERELRDAIGSRLYSGTSDIQRNIIARCMRL